LARSAELTVRPLTAARWKDLEALFGKNGACGGCWCMFWRQNTREYAAGKGEKNRRAFRRLVRANAVPGLLGYVDGAPVAWVAVQPREAYARILRSRRLLPAREPVWSVPCFFVSGGFRDRGLSRAMLEAAAAHARRHGAKLVEGYPVDPRGRSPAAFAFPGFVSTFEKCGFHVAARPSATRPIMRLGAD